MGFSWLGGRKSPGRKPAVWSSLCIWVNDSGHMALGRRQRVCAPKIPTFALRLRLCVSLLYGISYLIHIRKDSGDLSYPIQKEQWLQGEDSNSCSLMICCNPVAAQYRGKKAGNDSRFFSSSKKGENHELREELRSPQRDRKRDAVKKVSVDVLSHWGQVGDNLGFADIVFLSAGYRQYDHRKGCLHALYGRH